MTYKEVDFSLETRSSTGPVRFACGGAIIAGWTGRDPESRDKHIRELAEIGVAPPSSTPLYYRVAASTLTTDGKIEALGTSSSGEVEFVLLNHGGRLLVGVGSDHTDRDVETYNVAVSKQMCEKPLASTIWDFAELRDHWDRLVTRSWIYEGGGRVLYQEGPVANMLPPQELLDRLSSSGLPEGFVMFCGTHAAKGGIRPSSRFEFELEDPVLGRRIGHGYDISSLPIVS